MCLCNNIYRGVFDLRDRPLRFYLEVTFPFDTRDSTLGLPPLYLVPTPKRLRILFLWLSEQAVVLLDWAKPAASRRQYSIFNRWASDCKGTMF
jgi:hypothetical protein